MKSFTPKPWVVPQPVLIIGNEVIAGFAFIILLFDAAL